MKRWKQRPIHKSRYKISLLTDHHSFSSLFETQIIGSEIFGFNTFTADGFRSDTNRRNTFFRINFYWIFEFCMCVTLAVLSGQTMILIRFPSVPDFVTGILITILCYVIVNDKYMRLFINSLLLICICV